MHHKRSAGHGSTSRPPKLNQPVVVLRWLDKTEIEDHKVGTAYGREILNRRAIASVNLVASIGTIAKSSKQI